MSTGPGLFSDIGKKAKDLLTRDYSTDHRLTFSSTSESGMDLTSAAALKNGGLYAFDVGTKHKYKNTHVDVKMDNKTNFTSAFTVSEILPSTKAIVTLKYPDYSAGKIEVQHFHHHAALTSAVALKQTPSVDLSATIGAHGVTFGAEAGFDTASGAFAKYSAGISMTKPDYCASVILADKGDTLTSSYVHYFNKNQSSAAATEITRKFATNENIVTIGGAYTVDPQTAVKARINNSGKLATLIRHEFQPKSFLTLSSEFDCKALDKSPKFGVGLILCP